MHMYVSQINFSNLEVLTYSLFSCSYKIIKKSNNVISNI